MTGTDEIIRKCEAIACRMRINALKMAYAAGPNGAHLGGGLSMIEIMSVLYCGVMNVDPRNPHDPNRDRFILSKGHGVLALYAALNEAGFIAEDELCSFKSNQTCLYGHPSLNMDIGIEFSSGSLGQGLSLGIGCALAGRRRDLPYRTYVVLGDGEMDEGSVWEAAMAASHYGLSNLVAIIDKNGLQYDGNTDDIMSLGNIAQKWSAFGWDAVEVDGHNIEQLYHALIPGSDRPRVIIAHTIKGKGVSFMENNPAWHHSVISKSQFEQALSEQPKGYADDLE